MSARRSRGPAFLCVGPEKTGTSWLYENLGPHPDVFLTPVKEIRYFKEVEAYPDEGWRERLSARGDWHARDHRAYLRSRAGYYLARPRRIASEWRRLRWDLRFLFGRRRDEWYLSLFEPARGRVAGDISPQYFSLPDARLLHIRALLPDARVIILLRDPVDWSWSFARMTRVGRRRPEDVPDEELLAFFDECAAYYPTVSAIARWRRLYPPTQLFIGFYDALVESPRAFFDEVCDFLGLDAGAAPPHVLAGLSTRVNEGRDVALPHRFAVHLARRWRGEIERLCDDFAPYPQRWRERWAALASGEPRASDRERA